MASLRKWGGGQEGLRQDQKSPGQSRVGCRQRGAGEGGGERPSAALVMQGARTHIRPYGTWRAVQQLGRKGRKGVGSWAHGRGPWCTAHALRQLADKGQPTMSARPLTSTLSSPQHPRHARQPLPSPPHPTHTSSPPPPPQP